LKIRRFFMIVKVKWRKGLNVRLALIFLGMQGDWLLIKDFATGDFLLRDLCHFYNNCKINVKSRG